MSFHNKAVQPDKVANDLFETISEQYRILVDILCQLCESYYYQGNLDAAMSLLESNIHILSTDAVTPEDRSRFQVQRGKMLYYRGAIADTDSDASLPVLLDAQKLAQSVKDGSSLAKTFDLIGLVFYSQAFSNGDFAKPREYFQQALELRQHLDDKQGVCESLFHLGLTYQNKDNRTDEDRQKALTCFQQAKALAETGAFKLEESYIVRHIAAEYQEDGDWEKALTGFERSLTLREQIGYKIYQPTALLTLGQFHQSRQELDRALNYYQRAYDLAKQMNLVMYSVRAQIALGDLEKGRGSATAALQHYEAVLQAANSANYQNGVAQARARIEEMT